MTCQKVMPIHLSTNKGWGRHNITQEALTWWNNPTEKSSSPGLLSFVAHSDWVDLVKMSLILHFTYMLMSIDRSCHLHVASSGSATSIVYVSDDNSQKPEDLPGETYQHWSASFRRTARAINTLPPLARTPRVLGMENSFTVKKERKGSQLVRTVSVFVEGAFSPSKR